MSIARVLAYAAGGAFVAASAAINLLHVVGKDGNHPTVAAWGVVAVAASIGLGVLPGAVVRSFASRRYGLAVVALVGICLLGAFSIGNAIGSAAHTRLSQHAAAGDLRDSRQRVQAELQTIDDRLARLPSARSEPELTAKVNALLASRRDLKDCVGWLPDVKARAVCVEVGELQAEAAYAQERRKLEADRRDLSGKLDGMGRKGAIGNADAIALAGWLQALGINATPEAIDRVLILVAVATVEFGGGILIAVSGAFGVRQTTVAEPASGSPVDAVTQTPAQVHQKVHHEVHGSSTDDAPVVHPETPANTGDVALVAQGAPAGAPSAPESAPESAPAEPTVADLAQPVERLVHLLQARGEIVAGQRSLASAIGVSPSTMGRLLRELADAGRVTVETTPKGSRVKLAA